MSLSLAARVATALILTGAPGAHAMPMNGTFTIHYDKQAPQPIAPDHVRIEESGSGLNKSPSQPLDNAQVTLQDTVTLVRGRGPVKGTITFTTPDGSATSAVTGKVTTDAQDRMTAAGTFKMSNATGAMAGMRGRGSFSSTFSSQADQTTQWQGDFKLPKPVASNR